VIPCGNKKEVSRTIQTEDTGCKISIFSVKVKNSVINSKVVEQVIVLQLIKAFPHIVWSVKVHNHVHKNPQLFPILR